MGHFSTTKKSRKMNAWLRPDSLKNTKDKCQQLALTPFNYAS